MLFEILVPFIIAEPDLGARGKRHSQLKSTRFPLLLLLLLLLI